MKKPRKERIAQLASDIQRMKNVEADFFRELVNLLFEDAKHSLVSSEGEQTLRLQGEARALQKLYTQLTRPSPVAQQEQ